MPPPSYGACLRCSVSLSVGHCVNCFRTVPPHDNYPHGLKFPKCPFIDIWGVVNASVLQAFQSRAVALEITLHCTANPGNGLGSPHHQPRSAVYSPLKWPGWIWIQNSHNILCNVFFLAPERLSEWEGPCSAWMSAGSLERIHSCTVATKGSAGANSVNLSRFTLLQFSRSNQNICCWDSPSTICEKVVI